MKKTVSLLAVLAALMVSALPLMAQQKRVSPHETVSTVIDGDRVMVIYGRPYTTKPGTTEPRKIWGKLVPYDQVWRAGADEATLLVVQKPIKIGDTAIAAGAYTLFMLPKEDGTAKLIINKGVGNWGEEYSESDDVARVDLKKADLEKSVNQFTMAVAKAPGGGIIKLSWENAEYSVAFTVQK